MYCKNCGKEISDTSSSCSFCGSVMDKNSSGNPANPEDTGGFLWCLLGFCIPIVGLILFLVWRQEKPLTAKAVGKGALISAIISAVLTVLYFVLVVGLIGLSASQI